MSVFNITAGMGNYPLVFFPMILKEPMIVQSKDSLRSIRRERNKGGTFNAFC